MHKKLLLIADCNAVASQNWFHHATRLLGAGKEPVSLGT